MYHRKKKFNLVPPTIHSAASVPAPSLPTILERRFIQAKAQSQNADGPQLERKIGWSHEGGTVLGHIRRHDEDMVKSDIKIAY